MGAPPGRYADPESGLVYLRARYYDPTTGQFLSRDPLIDETGSAYGYVNNNPLNGTDPLGLDPCIDANGQVGGGGCYHDGPGGGELVDANGSPVDCSHNAPVLAGAAGGADSGGTGGDGPLIDPGHTKGKRPSTEEKHQRGDQRRKTDKGGEKGDARRRGNPNKRSSFSIPDFRLTPKEIIGGAIVVGGTIILGPGIAAPAAL